MNKRFNKFVIVFLAVLLILPLNATFAQDEGEGIVCDSSLILSLFVAEYELGYEPMMDVSVFEKGQFTDLFDAMMMMDEEMMDEESMDEEEMMDDEAMDEEEMMDDEMIVMLAPAQIEGEDPACTELRESLDSYIYAHYSMTMMMEDDM